MCAGAQPLLWPRPDGVCLSCLMNMVSDLQAKVIRGELFQQVIVWGSCSQTYFEPHYYRSWHSAEAMPPSPSMEVLPRPRIRWGRNPDPSLLFCGY